MSGNTPLASKASICFLCWSECLFGVYYRTTFWDPNISSLSPEIWFPRNQISQKEMTHCFSILVHLNMGANKKYEVWCMSLLCYLETKQMCALNGTLFDNTSTMIQYYKIFKTLLAQFYFHVIYVKTLKLSLLATNMHFSMKKLVVVDSTVSCYYYMTLLIK